jgi:hypothetical protein
VSSVSCAIRSGRENSTLSTGLEAPAAGTTPQAGGGASRRCEVRGGVWQASIGPERTRSASDLPVSSPSRDTTEIHLEIAHGKCLLPHRGPTRRIRGTMPDQEPIPDSVQDTAPDGADATPSGPVSGRLDHNGPTAPPHDLSSLPPSGRLTPPADPRSSAPRSARSCLTTGRALRGGRPPRASPCRGRAAVGGGNCPARPRGALDPPRAVALGGAPRLRPQRPGSLGRSTE